MARHPFTKNLVSILETVELEIKQRIKREITFNSWLKTTSSKQNINLRTTPPYYYSSQSYRTASRSTSVQNELLSLCRKHKHKFTCSHAADAL